MDIKEFAEQHRLRVHRDDCGDLVISGKNGNIFDGYGEQLGLYLAFSSVRQWKSAKKQLEKVDCVCRQNGDIEGILTFNPAHKTQVQLAIKLARIRVKRVLTPEKRHALSIRLSNARIAKTGLKCPSTVSPINSNAMNHPTGTSQI